MLRRNSKLLIASVGVSGLLMTGTSQAAGAFDSSFTIEKQIERAAAQTQRRVDALAEQTAEMAAEYKLALAQADSLRAFNAEYRKQVDSQAEEIVKINDEIESIDATEKGILPLMVEMVDTLDEFVKLDMPFMVDERRRRVAQLRVALEDAGLQLSEKYRQILEAYEIEVDYGDTISRYKQDVETNDGTETKVDVLRIGRIALMYLTPDETEGAYWDKSSGSWQALDDSYIPTLKSGLKIAGRGAQPDLLPVPVQSAGGAQ